MTDSGTAMGYVLDDFIAYASRQAQDTTLRDFRLLMARELIHGELTAKGYATMLKYMSRITMEHAGQDDDISLRIITIPDDMLARGVERSRIILEREVRKLDLVRL